MVKIPLVVCMLWTTAAYATDPCDEARWAAAEFEGYRLALLVIQKAHREQCPQAPKPVCQAYLLVAIALAAGGEQAAAVRDFRRNECAPR